MPTEAFRDCDAVQLPPNRAPRTPGGSLHPIRLHWRFTPLPHCSAAPLRSCIKVTLKPQSLDGAFNPGSGAKAPRNAERGCGAGGGPL